MISWPHRMSANIINTCFWFLETCTKRSYFIVENIRPGAQRWHLKWSMSISYASHEYTVGRRSALGQVSRQAAVEVLIQRIFTNIFVLRNKTDAFKKKLALWDSFVQKGDTEMFLTLNNFLTSVDVFVYKGISRASNFLTKKLKVWLYNLTILTLFWSIHFLHLQ